MPKTAEQRRRAKLRARLVRHQQGRCFYCRRTMTTKEPDAPLSATVDHLVPWSSGGPTEPGNTVAACKTCNQAKGTLSAQDFMAVIAEFERGRA